MASFPLRVLYATIGVCAVICVATPSGTRAAGPDEKTRYDYAATLYSQGAYDTAVKELTAFVADYPKGQFSDDAYYLLGKQYMSAGKTEDALDQFRIILALIPDGDKAPAAQFELAAHWYNPSNPSRDLERAIAEFMKIPFFHPDSPQADDAAYYAAVCQLEQGNYAQAGTELAAFIGKYPASEYAAPAGYRLGMAYLMEGDTADALTALQSVRDAHPAGLYAGDALDTAELAIRARDRVGLTAAYVQGVKGDGPGSFNRPQGVAIGPDGVVYVADTANGRVQVFTAASGKMEIVSASLAPATLERDQRMDEPAGVAVGPKGRVFVTDSALHRVQVFEPDGRLVFSFGRKGEGQGELHSPSGIAVDAGGFAFVADTGNRRVAMFDPSGRFVRNIGAPVQGAVNTLKSPAGVAVDIKGNILVTDSSADAIFGYDRKGELVMLYTGGKDSGPQLKDPCGIAVDRAGNVYVADYGRGSVLAFDMGLRPLTEFPAGKDRDTLDRPMGISVSAKGNVFVADSGNSQVVVFK